MAERCARQRRGVAGRLAYLVVLGLVVSLLSVLPAVGDDHDQARSLAPTDADGRDASSQRLPARSVEWASLTDRLIVTPAPAVAPTEASERAAQLGAADAALGRSAGGGRTIIELGEDLSFDEADALARRLVQEGLALTAEPEPRVTIASPPVDDPHYPFQWHLHGPSDTAFGIDAPSAWSVTTGSEDVVVAVIDTGVLDHPDLVDRLVPGWDFVDRKAGGWDPGDWTADDQCKEDVGGTDSSWHGLHVAGTIGATTDNGINVAGVDQAAKVLPVRVLGPCGGQGQDVVDGIRWAAGLPVAGADPNLHPAHVINLSLGGPAKDDTCWSDFQTAINEAVAEGVVVVAAAGNSGLDAQGFQPANCAGVVTVAATGPLGERGGRTESGERVPYSNFGTVVDVAAPGGDTFYGPPGMIFSTDNDGATTPGVHDTWVKAGTSMAAPHVSGVASLILAADPDLSRTEVQAILEDTAKPFATSSDAGPTFVCSDDPAADHHCGAGIVDAGAAVAVASLKPPTLSAEPGSEQVTLSWSPVAPAGGLDRYELFQSTTATCTADDPRIYNDSGTTHTETGLTDGTTYLYCIRTIDQSSDASRLSTVVSAVPKPPPPAAPENLTATPGTEQVSLTWDPVVAADTYELFQTQGSTACSDAGSLVYDGADTAHTAEGLTAGVTYRYCVRALDTHETPSEMSDPAEAVPTFPPAPATPGNFSATPGTEQVSLKWQTVAGADKYELLRSTGSTPCASGTTFVRPGSSSSLTQTKLKAGTKYNYCIRSVDVYGQRSGFSPQKSATPTAPLPAAPTWSSDAKLRFDLISGGVKLSWPKAKGTVSHYQVQRGSTTVATTTSLSRNVTGLSNGQRYRLRVRAVNSGGTSPWLTIHGSPTSGFRDVASGSTFHTDIRWLATAEVTRGCNPPTNDRYCPTDVVTREQMAAFMVRALGLTATSSKGNFTDVPSGSTFHRDINRLATAGITAGCNPPSNTRFCPKDPVTRQQMAAFMRRALAG